MRIVEKKVDPSFTPAQAFMAQRGKEPGSARLRAEVKRLLDNGMAHTTTVAKVFELLVNTDTDRIGPADIQRVLPAFEVQKGNGW